MNTGDTIETGNNFAPRKSLGQHWLIDNDVLERIIEIASISNDDNILEIGPGTGLLTDKLVSKAQKVTAVELDHKLAVHLSDKKIPNLQVIEQDILSFDLSAMPSKYKIVANIPYYLTGKLIRKISEAENRPELVVLLVQKEIAERMAARPGQLSILGVTSQYYWNVTKDLVVGPDSFQPPPEVYSQLVILEKLERNVNDDLRKKVFGLVRSGFSSKRKTLANNLKSLGVHKTTAEQMLAKLSMSPMTRAQSLSVEQWISLAEAVLAEQA